MDASAVVVLIVGAVLSALLFWLKGSIDMLGKKEHGLQVQKGLEQFALSQQQSLKGIEERMTVLQNLAQGTIKDLSGEVRQLQNLMDNSQARGAFGEASLEALVKDQLPAGYYQFQHRFSTGVRVDCLLKFDAPLGPLSIDSKFPLIDYQAVAECKDSGERPQLLKQFAARVREQVRAVAEKYIVVGETSDRALMFVPSEAVFVMLYRECVGVVDEAQQKRVFIVSPTTLWAILNTMRAVLKNVRMQEQAALVQDKVQGLLQDVRRLGERNAKLKRHFDGAVTALQEMDTSVAKIDRQGDDIVSLELGDDTQEHLTHRKDGGIG
ncbi:MAG: DNA recombination protein RmuC [Alphaproteobacteria bacterium GM202ARS2]|nr:DNA recombination protein RmuC [Alphaproteobacteria bacterium GM202ARS2]